MNRFNLNDVQSIHAIRKLGAQFPENQETNASSLQRAFISPTCTYSTSKLHISKAQYNTLVASSI